MSPVAEIRALGSCRPQNRALGWQSRMTGWTKHDGRVRRKGRTNKELRNGSGTRKTPSGSRVLMVVAKPSCLPWDENEGKAEVAAHVGAIILWIVPIQEDEGVIRVRLGC